MAFKRSAVRSRLSPPGITRLAKFLLRRSFCFSSTILLTYGEKPTGIIKVNAIWGIIFARIDLLTMSEYSLQQWSGEAYPFLNAFVCDNNQQKTEI